jgi:hypothetical protein
MTAEAEKPSVRQENLGEGAGRVAQRPQHVPALDGCAVLRFC